MRGFEGEGGKTQRQRKKPRTAQGRAFLQDVELGSRQFIRSLDPQPTNALPSNENTNQLHGLEDDDRGYKGQEGNGPLEPKPVDIRVQQLQDYLQSQDYIERKLLEEKHWEETREWRRTLSSAFDAYREMMRREKCISELMLDLGPMDKLANVCPKCFGPHIPGKQDHKPNYILCMDGNFQHRRHLKASVELPNCIKTPSIFVAPDEVEKMERCMNEEMDQEPENQDRCTKQHTAADDVRTGKTWKECDETGLFGMACRHDQIINLINIVQSEGEEYTKKLSFLYDIGCNIEKGVIRRNQFPECRERNLLSFGTSVFHAYVHEWKCQLRYNPRLNDGWGMSDGEGMEQIWAFFLPLIRQLRYCTKNHRLVAVDIRSHHHNDVGWVYALHLLFEQGTHVEELKKEASGVLDSLLEEFGHTREFFKAQWTRQREIQLLVVENQSEKEMLRKIEELVELEDKLGDTNNDLVELRETRRRTRTASQRQQLEQLPDTISFLEGEINSIVVELGSENFRDLPGATDSESKALLKLKVSKSKLYEAKVGVIEMQKKWDRGGSGTQVQERYKKQMTSKVNILKKKWLAYSNRAEAHNSDFTPRTPLSTPTLEEVKSCGIKDSFWNMGALSHPDEPWAIDSDVQKGIQAYLTLTHCQDELHRIAREARQAVQWAINKSEKLSHIGDFLTADVPTTFQHKLNQICKENHFPRSVLQSIFGRLAQHFCRLWMMWNVKCKKLLRWSKKYLNHRLDSSLETEILERWDLLINNSRQMWEKLITDPSVIVEVENLADSLEEEILDQEALEYARGDPDSE
ncbi:hypothetical protein PTTG_04955 [Puccinia triticina 1-1 BBBD Race 1]|uniref:CxC1-like cysteine cluster associated with KDZ transposases domain-containing protein n=1 Tax=Puccinia triticina (isolate 1-1 / race 1 (BBBD)) TaxID=630390 RepID=A0A180GLB1_PUCT1|nr:hypothetical protein PTTG_04955 [Puccinia triticina 1-1 BBBD Race 1]